MIDLVKQLIEKMYAEDPFWLNLKHNLLHSPLPRR